MMRCFVPLLPVFALLAATTLQTEIETWHRDREARLRGEDGWLTVAGLFWLHPGVNKFGTDPKSDIALPAGPAHAGSFNLQNGKVTATVDGKTRAITHDSDDFVQAGRLRLFVIQRGDRMGIRLRDPDSQYRRGFKGIASFPASPAYRVTARFVAEPRKIPILNVLGQTEDSECPGYVVFRLAGKEHRLYPIIETPGDKELFYIFRDLTAGKETYGAGRFLYSDLPKDGKVVLDFNKAYNPPCAFTPYATCPLPPKQNHIAVRIEAGEKAYHFD
jgi:uncharacterized protein (DUF1684 family)